MKLILSLLIMLLSIGLQPKQKELKQAIEYGDNSWIGYGGARGGGKSNAVDDLAIYYGFKYQTYSLIFRRFYNELLDNHINPIFKRYPFLRKFYNSSDKILYHPTTKAPIVRFGYAENEADIYKFQGPSYPLIFVDEATQSTEEMITFLKTSNRDPYGQLPSVAKIIETGNPGGVGHTYFKRLFIDKLYKENETPDKYFIQAHVWDNVFWCLKELKNQGLTVNDYYYKWSEQQRIDFTLKYSDYAKNLAGLPDQLKMAYLWGDWNTFGGMFFKGFDVTTQLIEPFEIPAAWTVVGSLDPGFASPLSFGLTTKDYEGRIVRIATWYNIDKIPNNAAGIKIWLSSKESPIYPYLKGRMPNYTVAGRDAFSKLDKNALQSNEDTVEQYFADQGIYLINGNDGSGTRIPNWWRWKSLIPDKYLIFKNLNTPLIEQITSVESDDKVVEDIRGRGNDEAVEDHCLDEQKLAIAALITPKEKKEPETVARPFLRKQQSQFRKSKF